MSKLLIEIISVRRSLFKGKIDTLVVPGTKGAFKVLPHHTPILSTLVKGEIVYVITGKECRLPIESGFIDISDNNITICVKE